ncbi:MAG: hypothetical protein AAGC55_02780 [Myxococcota bacterium]
MNERLAFWHVLAVQMTLLLLIGCNQPQQNGAATTPTPEQSGAPTDTQTAEKAKTGTSGEVSAGQGEAATNGKGGSDIGGRTGAGKSGSDTAGKVGADKARAGTGGSGGGERAAAAGGILPLQGQPCPNDVCAEGLQCLSYYGFAGSRGPKFTSCEHPCADNPKACPEGQTCVTIADGPGMVCRPR